MVFRKSCGDSIKRLQADYKRKEEANRRMIAHLAELLENDKITNDFDKEFIANIQARFNAGIPLSEKQQAHLETCYHDRY